MLACRLAGFAHGQPAGPQRRIRAGRAAAVPSPGAWVFGRGGAPGDPARSPGARRRRTLLMLEGSCLCGKVRCRFDGVPEGATACNCTACRRCGVLWICGHEGLDVNVSGDTSAYTRREGGGALAFHFRPGCGCVTHWLGPEADGRWRLAVNLRLVSDPEQVAAARSNISTGSPHSRTCRATDAASATCGSEAEQPQRP